MPDRVISVPQATQIAQRIKNKFDNVNGRLQQILNISVTETNGYIDTDGSIKPQTSEARLEVYTNTVSVSPGEKLTAELSYTSAHWMWYCYALYDASGAFMRRESVPDSTGYQDFAKIEITIPDGIYGIAFTYRTYGVSDFVLTVNNSINDLLLDVVEVKETLDNDVIPGVETIEKNSAENEAKINTVLSDIYIKSDAVVGTYTVKNYTLDSNGNRIRVDGKYLKRYNDATVGSVVYIELATGNYAVFKSDTQTPGYTADDSIIAVIQKTGYMRVPAETKTIWVGADDAEDHVYTVKEVGEFSNLTVEGNKNVGPEISTHKPSTTRNGVTFTFDKIGNVLISGEATTETYAYAHYNLTGFPDGVSAGSEIYAEFACDDPNVKFIIYYTRNSSGLLVLKTIMPGENFKVKIPDNATGISYRIQVESGWIGNAKAVYAVLSAQSNKMLTHDVYKLLNRIENIPDYYFENDYLPNKLVEIGNASGFISGVTFAFITDLHFSSNSKLSKYLLKYVLDKTSCDYVIVGGDYGMAAATEEVSRSCIADLLDYSSYVGHDKFFALVGNHDFTGSEPLTWGETYNAICRPSERYKTNVTNEGSFCIDIPAQKTRFICINTTPPQYPVSASTISGSTRYFGASQLRWIADRLIELSGYNIIFISHIPTDPEMYSYAETFAPLQTILEKFVSKQSGEAGGIAFDFTSATSKLICHINGHEHRDESHYSNGVLSIATTCDAHYSDDGYGAAVGTITEQAFDVYCIDFDAETITTVRVGRGVSRKLAFDGTVLSDATG